MNIQSTYEFNALTVINLVEIVQIENKTAKNIRNKFSQSWSSGYPRQNICVYDNGGECTGLEFQRLLEKMNIKDVPTISRSLTANSIRERMHQSVSNILRTLLRSVPSKDITEVHELIDEALSTAQYALRTCVHTILGSTPGALTFGRDMFLNVPLQVDWKRISSRHEQTVKDNLKRANARPRQCDYSIGQKVLKLSLIHI